MEVKQARLEDYPQKFLTRAEELEEKLGYRFQNKMLLLAALTHSSFSNENTKYRNL